MLDNFGFNLLCAVFLAISVLTVAYSGAYLIKRIRQVRRLKAYMKNRQRKTLK